MVVLTAPSNLADASLHKAFVESIVQHTVCQARVLQKCQELTILRKMLKSIHLGISCSISLRLRPIRGHGI